MARPHGRKSPADGAMAGVVSGARHAGSADARDRESEREVATTQASDAGDVHMVVRWGCIFACVRAVRALGRSPCIWRQLLPLSHMLSPIQHAPCTHACAHAQSAPRSIGCATHQGLMAALSIASVEGGQNDACLAPLHAGTLLPCLQITTPAPVTEFNSTMEDGWGSGESGRAPAPSFANHSTAQQQGVQGGAGQGLVSTRAMQAGLEK